MNRHDLDERMMRLALEEADRALEQGEVPVGAVIVREGEVIARAHNTREQDKNPVGHAEINAIRQAAQALGDWRLTGCTLYVTLEPCGMCAGAIGQARLGRVVFGAYDAPAGCCGSVYRLTEDPAFPWFVPADGGVLEQECAERLQRAGVRFRKGPDSTRILRP